MITRSIRLVWHLLRQPVIFKSCEKAWSRLFVFNWRMRNSLSAVVLAVSIAVGGFFYSPSPGNARIIEVGKTAEEEPLPGCPDNCLAVTRTTGFQVQIGGKRNLLVVPENGKIVAWSIGLGSPGSKDVEFFKRFGETPSAGITVLESLRKKYKKGWKKDPRTENAFRTVDHTPVQSLTPYFGQTVQFPLDQTINVKKGHVLALSVPTWAPALAFVEEKTSWRANRATNQCKDVGTQTVHKGKGMQSQYQCQYNNARLMYSVTIITNPKPTAGRGKAPQEAEGKAPKEPSSNDVAGKSSSKQTAKSSSTDVAKKPKSKTN